MTMNEQHLLSHARAYLAALERDVDAATLREFFTPDVTQIEHPNRLVPGGAIRILDDLLTAAERGRAAVAGQRFDVQHAIVQGDTVAMEIEWSAVLRVAIGSLAAGDSMHAWFAVFLTYRDGKICHQRNYDCFKEF